MMPQAQHRRSPCPQTARRQQKGLALVAALVCLLIVTSIIASMLQGALRTRRQLRAERDRRQAELLVEAGVDRAAGILASQPNFRGDTWNLPATAIVGSGAGRVMTEISRAAADENWQVHVVAEYPLDRDFPVHRSHTFKLASPPTLSQEQSQ